MTKTGRKIPNTAGSCKAGDSITRTEISFTGRSISAAEAERKTVRTYSQERIQKETDAAKPHNQITKRTIGIRFKLGEDAGTETEGPATNGMLMSAKVVIGR